MTDLFKVHGTNLLKILQMTKNDLKNGISEILINFVYKYEKTFFLIAISCNLHCMII